MCVFIPVSLVVLLMGTLWHPKRFDLFTKWGCRRLFQSLLIRIKVDGASNFKKGSNYLFICNHVNIFDVFVLYGYIPNYFRGLELDEHFDWFYYGKLIRRLGMIPISQTNARSALKSLKEAQGAVKDGTSIVILPEGGRTLDGKLQPFKRGAFLLAKKAQVDIVPMAMVGAFRIKRKGNWLIRPGKMVLRFGKPIAYSEIKGMTLEEISALVRHHILELIGKGTSDKQKSPNT